MSSISLRRNHLTAVCCFIPILHINTAHPISNYHTLSSLQATHCEMNSKIFLVALVLCTVVAVRGDNVLGTSSCEGVNGTSCKSRDGVATKSSSSLSLGVLNQGGSSEKGPVATKSACYYSSYYTGYVPRGYYRCGTGYWLKFNTLGLVYSNYCYNGYVYGKVYAYVITTGTCKISFIQYGFYTNAVQVRAYYCC